MNYYFNYTSGLIDNLLVRTKAENYTVDGKRANVTDPKAPMPGRLHDQSRAFGELCIPIDGHKRSFLRDYLDKLQMKPSTGDINYDVEYASPFGNEINKLLLLFKWITGIQSITKDTVHITKEDLKAIDMEHMSTLDLKKTFSKIFWNSLVTNMWNDGIWTVKIGSRDLRVGEGPGYINMRVSIPHLVQKIEEYHNNLKDQKKQQEPDTYNN